MALTKRQQLRDAGRLLMDSIRKSASVLSESSDLFLAHSSQDKGDVLNGAIKTLQDGGARVYADFLDPVANALSPPDFGNFFDQAIRDTRRLVVLLTEKTATSRWVPWELGLAHGVHEVNRAAVWPINDTGADEIWARQEFLLVYPSIEWVRFKGNDQYQWAVRVPSNGEYWSLEQWLEL
ncbi:MAG: toll/interleukin-1 receptor domain-containing protein [Acidobacteria bacterium]|nr:toll/interleukin-1 receptor domain-containing protein [Acidobacteriota bacterium]